MPPPVLQQCSIAVLAKRVAGLETRVPVAITPGSEIDFLARVVGADVSPFSSSHSEAARWLIHVQDALTRTQTDFPFLFYGTDWLAFGHFVIALSFVGAIRDPVRNRWLFTFGMVACVLVIPYALVCGAIRAIPLWWRFIDCSFGVVGFIPMALCRRWVEVLEFAMQNETGEFSAVPGTMAAPRTK